MRMWMVNPKFLSDRRLLGEHGEIHKHRHNFVKGHKVDGRIKPIVQIEPASMKTRHDELSEEIARRWPDRNIPHKSPYEMPDLSKYPDEIVNAKIDLNISIRDLKERCPDCRKRLEEAGF